MKNSNVFWSTSVIGMLLVFFTACEQQAVMDYPVQPIPFTQVQIHDHFWAPRIETNRTKTIPFALQKNEETGRVDNFAIAAGKKEGKYLGRRFNDTDVYKVIEGAAYSLHLHPDTELESYLDDLITLIASAQEEDGYLYAARTADPENPAPGAGPERWSRLRGSHELYNAGHMYEAAIAYYMATGKRKFLDVAIKNADLLVDVFGPGKKQDFPGHQEIEIGLAKLYRVTGETVYLELAKFFLDERGHEHDGGLYAEDTAFALYNRKAYMQDHLPVLEQAEAVGHAVRASYMYAGMADVAALTGNPEYIHAIDRIWENVVSKKLYLTGGIGARHTTEAFGDNYELPNATAYCETCAAIGNALWNHRQFLLHGDAKFLDVLERVVYNGLISGVSLSGDRFFYQNPLESSGSYTRSPWFEVACCPGNITRFLPSFPGYIYAQAGDDFFINLFVSSEVDFLIGDHKVQLSQDSRYPWDGTIHIAVKPESICRFILNVRIPGWAQNQPVPSDLYSYLSESSEKIVIKVNGEPAEYDIAKGFAHIDRTWVDGDTLELYLPMPVRRVLAHDDLLDNRGKVALERGPLVYCWEWPDNADGVRGKKLSDDIELAHEFQSSLFGGVVVIQSPSLFAIPYYAWAHRGEGEMAVWIDRQ